MYLIVIFIRQLTLYTNELTYEGYVLELKISMSEMKLMVISCLKYEQTNQYQYTVETITFNAG